MEDISSSKTFYSVKANTAPDIVRHIRKTLLMAIARERRGKNSA